MVGDFSSKQQARAQQEANSYVQQADAARRAGDATGAAAYDDRARQSQATANNWSDNGVYRLALHAGTQAAVGGVAGGAGMAAAAAGGTVGGSIGQQLGKGLGEQEADRRGLTGLERAAFVNSYQQGMATVGGVVGGAVVGGGTAVAGAQGGGVAAAVDVFNRQLHPDETKWITSNAKRFAQQQGISEQEAEKRLGQQAQKQLQFGVDATEDGQARAFLSQAKGMLPADPNCPTCGPGYMFYATPEQRANINMYATQVASDPKALEFYGRNGLTQPTPKQIQTSANTDANIRSTVANATAGAAGVAVVTTVPPALTWCFSNPVACNRVVIAGGGIAAGDALGPAGLGVLGTASAVKAVRSADEVNAAMKARGWEPPWSPGTPVIETTLQPGTKVNMIVDAKTAEAIKDQRPFVPGGWATFDDVSSTAVDMRQRSAITNQFKPTSDGPFYVVEMEVTRPVNSTIGFVGKQTEGAGGLLRGGGTQVQFDETIKGMNRNSILKPVSQPKLLN
jgi:filamentous hemagglutinin